MSRDPSRIFLSAASGDYEQVRLNLAKALDGGGCHIVHQDAFPQTAADTLSKLAQLVDRCGVTVHIIGRQPGSIPRPEIRAQYLAVADPCSEFLAARPALRASLGDFSTITYTQWEAYIALHLGMPLFVYADPSHADLHHPQRDHLDRLKANGRYPESYVDEADLYRLVMADLMAHFRLNPATRAMAARIQPFNLPGGYIGRLFLGRDEFLEDIRASLQGSAHATAITQQAAATGISGLGGIGKTHAAVEYAHRHRADYSALLFATADSPERLHASLADLCGVLHLDENGSLPSEETARVAAALDWLAAHSGWLLIVDNVDDEAAALALTALLGRLTAGHVLITSRLHGWSDQVKNIDLDVLTDEAAADLLLRLTADRRRLAPDDEAQALELAKLLEGLPLAIHQAAGYINERTRTLADYQADYQREAETLLDWFNDLAIPYERPDKLAPRPVLVTWKTSFDQLTAEEQFWLLVFSHFAPEPVPEFLLEPLQDADPEVRAALDKAAWAVARAEKFCLLNRSRSEPVFKLHRLIRQVTRLQATTSDSIEAQGNAVSLLLHSQTEMSQDVRGWPRWNMLLNHAIHICNECSDDNAPTDLTILLHEVGSILEAKGLHRAAEMHHRRALDLERLKYGPDHPLVSKGSNDLAQLLLASGRIEEAEALMVEVLRIDELNLGSGSPGLAAGIHNYAGLLKAKGRYGEAEPLMQKVLEMRLQEFGVDNPRVAVALNNLAMLLKETGRLDDAEPLLNEALRIDRKAFGDDHPRFANRLNNLGQWLKAKGRLNEAEPLMRKALEIDFNAYGPDHPNVAFRLNNLARLFQETGRLNAAEAHSARHLWIFAEFGRRNGFEHPRLKHAIANHTALLEEIGLSESEIHRKLSSAFDIEPPSIPPVLKTH